MKPLLGQDYCEMCGSRHGDTWETRPTRPVRLSVEPRPGDPLVPWTICDECYEGLKGIERRRAAERRKS